MIRSADGVTRATRFLILVLIIAAVSTPDAGADEWLVYVSGGIESVKGAWTERRADVMFTQRGGTLVSVPYEDVDLATSAFITWHLNGRRRIPPRAKLPVAPPVQGNDEPDCARARVVAVSGGETVDVRLLGNVQNPSDSRPPGKDSRSGQRERVHAACLDAPEIDHRFVELGWYGRAMVSAVRLQFKAGDEVCLTEQSPPLKDDEGHRIVHIALKGGHDYSREVIAGGLGILRPARCDRAVEYRRLEDRAIAEQRGLWGAIGYKPAMAAANLVVKVAGGPGIAPPRGSGGG